MQHDVSKTNISRAALVPNLCSCLFTLAPVVSRMLDPFATFDGDTVVYVLFNVRVPNNGYAIRECIFGTYAGYSVAYFLLVMIPKNMFWATKI